MQRFPAMSDIAEAVNEAVEKARESKLNTIIAACVALAATFMAICNVKGGNVVQAMAKAQTETVDTWAFYQAKSTKQNMAEGMADQLIINRDVTPGLTPEARVLLDKKIVEWQAKAKRYEQEKDEIKKKADDLGKEYERLNVRDDQFDIGEACLSVGIALLGVTALTQKRWLLGVAGVFGGFGLIIGIAGFAGWNLHPEWLAKLLG